MSNDSSAATDGGHYADEPLLTELLDALRFDRLDPTVRYTGERSSLVGFAIVVVFIEVVVLQGYNVLVGRTVVYQENPLLLIRMVILIAAAMGTDSLFRRYDVAVEHAYLVERSDTPDVFRGLVPTKLTLIILGVGVVYTLLTAVVLIGLPKLYAVGGPARVARFLIITPFGYVPILGTFLATYVSVEVLLPRRIEDNVDVDFLDPAGLGGMRPVGELLKFGYYIIMIGLVGYAVAVYGPFFLGGVFAYEELVPPGPVVNLMFTAAWVATVLVMAYGIYVMHRFMAREKREELHRLQEEARDELDVDWNLQELDPTDPPGAYERYHERAAQISATKEYPATFTMWTQLLVGVMIPKALQLIMAGA